MMDTLQDELTHEAHMAAIMQAIRLAHAAIVELLVAGVAATDADMIAAQMAYAEAVGVLDGEMGR